MMPSNDRRNAIILSAADAFFRHSEELFFLKDMTLTYVHASRKFAEMTGCKSPEDVVGKTDFDLFEHDLAQKYVDDDRTMLATGKPMLTYVEPLPSLEGKPRYASTVKTLLRDEAGEIIGIYGVGKDITREHEARALYDRELAFLFTLSPETFAVVLFDITDWTVSGTRYRENDTFAAAHTIEDYQQRIADSVVENEEVRQFILSLSQNRLQAMYESGRRLFSVEYLRKDPDETPRWVRIESRFLVEPVSGHLMAAATLLDIDAEKRERAELLRAAEQDAMTGLLNHEATMRHSARYLETEGRTGEHALFMIDIDNFKQVNDTLGHITGDTIIKDIASAIRTAFRNVDFIGRIGGDEFLVLMKNVRDLAFIGQKAHELIDALQYVYNREGVTLRLSGSVGISLYSGDGKPLKQLYAEADAALYRAKAAGKNRYEIAFGSPLPQDAGPSVVVGVSSSVHLRTLLDNMDAAMLLCEVADDIRFIYASPSTFSRMGHDPSLLGENAEHLFSLILPEDLPTFREALFAAAKTGQVMDNSFRVFTAFSGKTSWRHARGVRLPESGNGIHRLLIISTDITAAKQSEEQLRFAELRYRTAVEQSDIMLWEADFRTGTLRHTGALAEDLGIAGRTFQNPPDTLLALGCIRSDYEAAFRRMYKNIFQANDTEDYVFVVIDTRKQEFPIRVHFRMLCDAKGTPFFAMGIGERLFHDSRELELYRTMPLCGVFSVRIDEGFTLLYGNDKYYAIHGYTRESMRERLNNRCSAYIHPDDLPQVRGQLEEALAAGKTSLLWIMRVVTGTGAVKYIQTSGALLFQRDGSCVMNGVAIDITAQKESENALNTEKRKLDVVLSSTDMFLWEHDIAKGRSTLQEKARQALGLAGTVFDDVPELFVRGGYLFKDSVEAYRELHRAVGRGERSATADIHLTAVYGKEAWMRCTFHTLFDAKGQPTSAICFALDISDFKRAENRYAKLLRERESIDKDAIGSFWFNLSADRCWGGHAVNEQILKLQEAGTVDGFFAYGYTQNTDPALRQAFRRVFNRKSLLEAFAEGKTTLAFEHRYRVAPGRDEWIRTSIHMMPNPETGEVEGLIYARNIHEEKISRALVERLVDIEYEAIALIDAHTGRLLLTSEYGKELAAPQSPTRYPDDLSLFFPHLFERDREDCRHRASLSAILAALKKAETCTFTYATRSETGIQHKKWQFAYLDATKNALVYTRSDVTGTYLAEIDPVTGIYNNAKFRSETRRLLDRNPKTSFVIARFDIDNFKVFNDFYGLEAGNDLLLTIGDLFRSSRRGLMTYGHVEADHFVFCVPESAFDSAPPLSRIAEALQKRHPEFDFSLRMGIYRIDDPALDIALMNDRAYLALRSIKKHFNRHVAYYDESMRRTLLHYQSIVSEMRDAFRNGEFGVYLQPQYNMETGELVGAEALVRWFHPVKGIIPPGLFIPVFESNGFITQIDKHVWELACGLLRRWLDNGLPVVPLSVNVSRIDIYDASICDTLVDLVEKYRLSPALLRLEITETAYMENPEQLIEVIKSLREKGFFIEMDDFGSGYSSLNFLKDVPVDMLKLDMHFLTESGDRARGGNILSSIIRMARWIDLPVIAEGVETREQADYLKSIGCLLVQGYFFARPLPTETFEALLGERKIGPLKTTTRSDTAKATQFWDASAQSALIFNSFLGGAAILEYENGNIEALRMNDRFFEILGTTREDYRGWMLHIQDRFVEESRQTYIDMLEAAVATGKEITCEIASKPLAADGEIIWTQNRARLLCHNGNSAILYVSVDNITSRKQLEAENRALSERLAALEGRTR